MHNKVQIPTSALDLTSSFSDVTVNNELNVIFQVREITLSISTTVSEAGDLYEMSENRGNVNVVEIKDLVEDVEEFANDFPKQTEGADDRLEWLVHLLDQVEFYR